MKHKIRNTEENKDKNTNDTKANNTPTLENNTILPPENREQITGEVTTESNTKTEESLDVEETDSDYVKEISEIVSKHKLQLVDKDGNPKTPEQLEREMAINSSQLAAEIGKYLEKGEPSKNSSIHNEQINNQMENWNDEIINQFRVENDEIPKDDDNDSAISFDTQEGAKSISHIEQAEKALKELYGINTEGDKDVDNRVCLTIANLQMCQYRKDKRNSDERQAREQKRLDNILAEQSREISEHSKKLDEYIKAAKEKDKEQDDKIDNNTKDIKENRNMIDDLYEQLENKNPNKKNKKKNKGKNPTIIDDNFIKQLCIDNIYEAERKIKIKNPDIVIDHKNTNYSQLIEQLDKLLTKLYEAADSTTIDEYTVLETYKTRFGDEFITIEVNDRGIRNFMLSLNRFTKDISPRSDGKIVELQQVIPEPYYEANRFLQDAGTTYRRCNPNGQFLIDYDEDMIILKIREAKKLPYIKSPMHEGWKPTIDMYDARSGQWKRTAPKHSQQQIEALDKIMETTSRSLFIKYDPAADKDIDYINRANFLRRTYDEHLEKPPSKEKNGYIKIIVKTKEMAKSIYKKLDNKKVKMNDGKELMFQLRADPATLFSPSNKNRMVPQENQKSTN